MTAQLQITEAEQALLDWDIDYTKRDDGVIIVEGDIHIPRKGLTKLPDLSKVIVKGDFWCHENKLTSLEGCPAFIGKSFCCSNNQLTSLKGAPVTVNGSFACAENQLTSLEGAPSSVGTGLFCNDNQLTSLAGAPVTAFYWCKNNKLTSLEDTPKGFRLMSSDFGDFTSWDAIPEDVRKSPETKEKERLARLETGRKIGEISAQTFSFKPVRSIRFQAGPK